MRNNNYLSIDFFTKFPQDVIFHIIAKLPAQSLIHLRCVSNFFNFIISHPHFLKVHLSSLSHPYPHNLVYYESTDYSKICFSFHKSQNFSVSRIVETPFRSVNGYLRLVGSVKAVLCLFDTNYFACLGTLILWNPFMGRFKIVPFLQGPNSFGEGFSHMAVGFGFDGRIGEIKIVMIMYNWDNEGEFMPEALVYGMNNGFWRSIGQIVPCFMPRKWSGNVFVNGCVHWLAYKRPKCNGLPNRIMAFSVVEEVFKVIELPRNLGVEEVKELRLCSSVDEESVALFVGYRENMSVTWSVWVMSEYGNVGSWTKRYDVVLEQLFVPLKLVNDGEVLAAICDEKFVLIDVEKEEFKDLVICGLPLSFCTTGYVPSLGLLDIGQRLVE